MTSVLQNKIFQARVQSISRRYPDHREDIAQHINITIFDLEKTDRRFARQKLGYKIKRAKWAAQDYIKKNVVVYDRFVASKSKVIDDEGEEVNFFDEFVSDKETIESILDARADDDAESAWREKVRHTVESLPKNQREIAYCLMRGMTNKREIAKKLKRGEWMIGFAIRKISKNPDMIALMS